MKPATLWGVITTTVDEWQDDRASTLAASLACYTLLSMSPLLVLTVAIVGFVVGKDAARVQIGGQVREVVGPQASQVVEDVMIHASEPTGGIIGTVVGVTVLLLGASGVFSELKDSLNAVWEVKTKPGRGILGIVVERFFSFTMVLAVAFILLVSLVISTVIAAMGVTISNTLPGGATVWNIANFVLSFGVVTVLFALMYKVIPDVKIGWGDVWPGAAVTAILFTIGKYALGLYLGRSSVASPYGAAGSLVALVLWVYYSAQIFFLGAEVTQVLTRLRGNKMEPTKNAVALTSSLADDPKSHGIAE